MEKYYLKNIYSKLNMKKFKYILDKIKNAPFIEYPFPHLEIDNFLSTEHFREIVNDNQIHFKKMKNNDELYNYLLKNHWNIQNFPGCITNWEQYKTYLKNPNLFKGNENISSIGITFRLHTIKNPLIHELIKFMNGNEFKKTLEEKFNIQNRTSIITAIQKNLTGYEISPHPDIKRKALTYLLNINKYTMETKNCHTHLLTFKPEYKHIVKEWETNERKWVPWDYCNTVKTINKNNTMILFKPSSDPPTLHAVKLNYNHLEEQRTQIYGNLMYNT